MVRDEGLLEMFKETADGLGQLFAEHMKLAKLELLGDLRVMRRQFWALVVVAPFLMVGYALVAVGAAAGLGRWLGAAPALAVVGVLHLGGGIVGGYLALARLRRTRILDRTLYQMNRSVSTLSSVQHVEDGRG